MPRLFHTCLLACVATVFSMLPAAAQPGQTQQLTSPDQTPEGLSKSDWQSIRAAYEAGRHEFKPIEGGWQARNPGQQWTTKFDGRGFITQPREGAWQWGLELESYGRGAQQQKVSGQPAVKAAGQRLSYQWNATVQEWWVNDQRGLEHGYTLAQRPVGAEGAVLEMTIATRGTLAPKVAADALGVLFVDASGATVLNYTGLKVWDADGKMLASRFEAAGEGRVRLRVEESAARYPITIDPVAQQAYVKVGDAGPGGVVNDNFGISVAVSGDTVVVGANQEDSSTTGVNSTPDENGTLSGAAYVFVRSGTTWSQQAYLKASQVNPSDNFGISVAVSGDTVVVGANREDSSTTGINNTPDEGAPDAGAAYVFVRSGTTWSQQAYLKASQVNTADNFGISVAVSGETVVVGASMEDSSTTGIDSTPNELASSAGAAYVFVRSGTTWSQQAYLKASQVNQFDQFGIAVAVSGDTVVVGANNESSSTTGIDSTPNELAFGAGAAYVFVRSGTMWSQQAYLKASQVNGQDQFGISVAVSGETVVVGASTEDSSTTGIDSTPDEGAFNAGAAYVFVRSGVTWSQQAYLKASQVNASDQFGISVAVSGDTVIVGAQREDSSTTGSNSTPDEGATDAGAAYIFVRNGATWSQQAYLKASQVTGDDRFGIAVAVSGETVVVGANQEDSGTTGINSTPDEAAPSAGAAYVFVRSGTTWSQEAYLKPSDGGFGGVGDQFGLAVAVSGDTVVVGAPFEDSNTTGSNSTPNELATDAGAAYVFVRSGATWSQQAYLKAGQVNGGDQFGIAVAVSGDTVVVGANFEDSNTTGIDSTPDEGASNAGAAYVFLRSGTTWSQQAYLKAGQVNGGDQFGIAVAVSGETVVVGASREDSSTTGVNSPPDEGAANSGAAYVFARSGTTWSQQAYLKASQVSATDQFGISVAVSGDTVVVGANLEDSSTTGIDSTPDEAADGAGAAYVFARSGTTWSQQAYLKASQVNGGDNFGISVAVSGETVVVGANGEDSSTTGINSTPDEGADTAGAAYVFARSGTTWTQQAYLKASQVNAIDQFGFSVAVSGDTVVVGAPTEDSITSGIDSTPDEAAPDAGAAYVFVRNGTTWSQRTYLKASQVTESDLFGISVAVAGDAVVVGANLEEGGSTGINSIPNERASNAGAAYIFTTAATAPTVSTPTSANVMLSSATLGGEVIAEGGLPLTERGVVFSPTAMNANPLLGVPGVGQATAAGNTTGVFTITVGGLAPHTAYTFKAYATNAVDIGYTGTATFTTPNTPPTAPSGNATGTTGDSKTITVNFPAMDADGDAVAITGAAAVTGLTVNGFTETTVTFTPGASFTGDASFTYTVSDGFGGTATGTITVAVTDNDAPMVATHANVTVEATDASGAIATYAPGSATDNVTASPVITYSKDSGTNFPLGPTTVTIFATDAANNTGTGTFTVTVVDTTPPVVTGTFSPLLILEGTLPNYTGLATATDEVGVVGVITQEPPAGSTVTPGTTRVTLKAKDAANNEGTKVFDVIVRPTVPVSMKVLAQGEAAPGRMSSADLPDDAVLASFGSPTIDDAGTLAFTAKWKSGTRVKGTGLFTSSECLAVVGGNASALAGTGATFKSFSDPVIDAGKVACLGTFAGVPKSAAAAVLSNVASGGALEIIARAGDVAPIGDGTQPAGGVKFKSFKAVSIEQGSVAVFAQLTSGTTEKATTANDLALFIQDGTNPLRLVLREGAMLEIAPGDTRTIQTLVSFAVGADSPGQGRGWLAQPYGPAALALVTFTDKSQAVVSGIQGGFAQVFARSGASGPTITDTTFATFGVPATNDRYTAAFLATMTLGSGGVTKADARAVFVSDGTGKYTPLARLGRDAGTTGAKFSLLKDPVLSGDDGVAFSARLTGGGLKPPATASLWSRPGSGVLKLLAQGGADAVDLPGSKWKAFTSLAIAGGGRGPIFTATLTPKATGVWATDFTGATRLLFRTGGTIGGKTVKKFTLLKATVGNAGVTRSFNDAGQVAWLATFTDKTTAIVVTEVP